MIFVILGMHKSGTTLLARALHESGIVMGQEFSAGIEYKKGKYEARWVQEINDHILGVDRQKHSLYVTSNLLPNGDVNDDIKERMRMGISEYQSRYPDWGFKDPKTVLTYNIWKGIMPDHRLIIIYRDPIEVWKRYYSSSKKLSRSFLPFRVWSDYNQLIVKYAKSAKKGQAILLNFEGLLSDTNEWDRFEDFIGVNVKDVRDTKQSVNRLAASDREKTGYKILQLMAGGKASKIYQELNELRVLGAG